MTEFMFAFRVEIYCSPKTLHNSLVSSRYILGWLLSFHSLICIRHMSLSVTVTSQWARWRLKSPASRVFAKSSVQAQIKDTSKLRVTGLCEGNSPMTGEFPAQMASCAENVSTWWRHHGFIMWDYFIKGCVMRRSNVLRNSVPDMEYIPLGDTREG